MGMKAKTIKSLLRKKIDDWLSSIDDAAVREAAAGGSIVTGGSIASMLLGEDINDFDIYFKDRKTAKTVAEYYLKKWQKLPKFANSAEEVKIYIDDSADDRIKIVVKSAGIASEDGDEGYKYFENDPDPYDTETYVETVLDTLKEIDDKEKPNYRPVFVTSNAITLANNIQLVMRFYGAPEEIHKNYDFVHCTNYWCSWDSSLTLRPEAMEALLARELRYVGSKYPICSLIRLRKFIKRDYKITAGTILKIAMQISQLDLTNMKVLEDQLIGVDVAYFFDIINRLKEKDLNKVDANYLIEILDRMF